MGWGDFSGITWFSGGTEAGWVVQLTANEGGGVGGGIYKNITEKGSKC